ncbi:MAG: hypothetical protein KF770_09535 [Anaerolineae bacterium]|nr:hypothetical protein [Anaerolineae bacterium]
MTDFVTLTCPSCGGQLQITNDIDRFACGHCGTEHLVRRGGGIVTLAPIVEGIKKVQVGTDKMAAELAIVRLEKEINQLNKQIDALNSRYDDIEILPTAFGAGIGGLILTSIVAQNFDAGLIVGVVVFVLAIIVIVALQIIPSSEIPPLQQQLEQKKQELAKQRNIVSK